MELGLEGRVAVVTGASRGIGRAVALALRGEGCDLVLCARNADALTAVAEELGGATVVPVDVTASGAPDAILEAAGGRVDILVNNAGGGAPKRIDRLTDDDWRAGFELNLFAAARMAGVVAPGMRAAGWGRIVSIASTYAREPDPSFAVYAAAKAALVNLTKSMSRAWSADGVLATCVVAGVTLTELVEENAAAVAERSGVTPDDVMAEVMARDPVAAGRFATPEEIAGAVAFLASERASWITGAALTVDGGTLRSI